MSDITSDQGAHEVPQTKNPLLNDVWYTRLEYIARVILPALATLYLAVAALWSFPAGPEVVGTIVAVDTFLGVFLGYAQKSYDASDAKYDGSINVLTNSGGGKLFSLDLDSDPIQLEAKSQVLFKVNSNVAS